VGVKIEEVDEIVEERAQVAAVAQEAFEGGDGFELGGEGEVLRDERGEVGLGGGGQQLVGACKAELLDAGAGLGGLPGGEGRELGDEVGPLGFGERGFGGAEEGRDGVAVQGGEGGGPGGVGTVEQRECAAGLDAGEGQGGDLGGGDGQVFGGEGEVVALAAVEGTEGARVVLCKPGAGEKVVDLGAHGGDGGGSRGGFIAEGLDGGRGALVRPCGEGGQLGEEGVEFRLIESGLAGAVGDTADVADDFGDECGGLVGGGGAGGEDAVAVEFVGGENFAGVGDIGEGDGVGGRFADGLEDALSGGECGAAFGGGVVELGEGEGVGSAQEGGGIFQVEGTPANGGEEFGDADAAVFIGVDEGECFLIDFEPFDGAAQGDPEFLVEVAEVEEVVGGFDGHLVECADSVEFPGVLFLRSGHGGGWFL